VHHLLLTCAERVYFDKVIAVRPPVRLILRRSGTATVFDRPHARRIIGSSCLGLKLRHARYPFHGTSIASLSSLTIAGQTPSIQLWKFHNYEPAMRCCKGRLHQLSHSLSITGNRCGRSWRTIRKAAILPWPPAGQLFGRLALSKLSAPFAEEVPRFWVR
jgi:hypothetical protein